MGARPDYWPFFQPALLGGHAGAGMEVATNRNPLRDLVLKSVAKSQTSELAIDDAEPTLKARQSQ